MGRLKILGVIILFLTVILNINLLLSTNSITGDFVYDNPTLPHLNPTLNASSVTVNNSVYWQGYTPTTLPHNILAGLQGGQSGQYYHLNETFYDQILNYALQWITATNVAFTNQSNSWSQQQNFTNITVNNIDASIINASLIIGYNTTDQLGSYFYNVSNPSYYLNISSLNSSIIMPLYSAVQEDPYGFNNPTGDNSGINATISWNNTQRNLSITGNYSYWYNGYQFFKNSSTIDSVIVPVAGSGIYYVYYVNSTLTSTIITETYFHELTTEVASIYWSNNTAQAFYIGDEKHGHLMPGTVHHYLHDFIGTRYISGLAPQNITVDGSGDTAAQAELYFSSGAIQDEDYEHLITNFTYPQRIDVYYQIGTTGNWSRKNGDNFTMIYSGDSTGYIGANARVPYNQFTGGVWSLTQTGQGNYALIHFFATNDINNSKSIFIIQGQSEYATLADAQTGATTEINNIVTTGLPMEESKALATIIIQTSTAYTNTPHVRFRSTATGATFIDWRQSLQTGSAGNLGGTVTLVNTGTGLTGGPITGSGTISIDNTYIQLFNDTTLILSINGSLYNYTYNVNQSLYNYINNLTSNITGGFVPYQGAINNLNMTGFNITSSNMYVPIGGKVSWDTNESRINNASGPLTANGTAAYMVYNQNTLRLEMWVNGKLQQDWGNSTTIYGTATFQSDAFFQNLSGVGLLINTNVIVDGNVTSNGIGDFQSLFAGNICYSDGTNCTSMNGTVANLTSLIMSINQSLTYQIMNLSSRVDSLNASIISINNSLGNYYSKTENVTPPINNTYSLGNSTNWWNSIYVVTVNTINLIINTITAITINTVNLNATYVNTTYLNATNITAGFVSTNTLAVGLNATNSTAEIKGNTTNIPITVCNNSVACYRFEEGSGTIAVDSSKYLNVGFIKSDTHSPSKGGNGTGSYSLNSTIVTSGYVVANDAPQINIDDNFTVSAWVYNTLSSDNNYIISKNNNPTATDGYMFYMKANDKVHFFVEKNGIVFQKRSSGTISLNTWHHIAATINGSTIAIYIDGVNQALENPIDSLAGVSTDLFLGVRSDITRYYTGYYDEVGIQNIVLNSTQVTSLYNNGFTFVNDTYPGFSNNAFAITRTSSGDIMVVDRFGRVGIHTATPVTDLDVNGSGRFTSLQVDKDLIVTGTIIGGSPVKISGGLTIISGDVNGSESNATFANMYDKTTVDSTFVNTTFAQGTYIPYTGAISDINFTGVNMTAGNILIPLGNYISWDVNITPNISMAYMKYNLNSSRLEMWVNGKIQQDWGNSTTIYGKATFEADAFFQNLSGEGLLVNTNLIVDGTIHSSGNATVLNMFAGNICYSDGTNCTYINGTFGNLTQYIMDVNQSLSLQIASLNSTLYFINNSLYAQIQSVNNSINNPDHDIVPTLNVTYNLGNSTNWWNNTYTNVLNAVSINVQTLNIITLSVQNLYAVNINTTNLTADVVNARILNGSLNWSNLNNIPYYLNSTVSPYLYNINSTVYLNETKLNETISSIADVNAYEQTVNITTSSGTGINISTPINYLLTQLIVTAPTNVTTFNFQATQDNATGFMVDKDRVVHIGIWNIMKQYSLTNDTLYLNISNSSVNGLFNVQIKYINNKIT